MSYIGANSQGIIASIDGGTISNATLDSSVTFPITAASYEWDGFNPSNLSGTITNAAE